jgi:hypothetical protein
VKLEVSPPLYLIGMRVPCWRCNSKMTVVTLLAPNVAETENQACLLSNIEQLPQEILGIIQKRVPTFQFRSSLMAGSKYFATTCPNCHVIYGDFFLHCEPGAPFFPVSEEEAKSIYLTEIPLSRPIKLEASPSFGVREMILSNGKRI